MLVMGCRAFEYEKLTFRLEIIIECVLADMALLAYVATPKRTLQYKLDGLSQIMMLRIRGETYRCLYGADDRMIGFVRVRIPIKFWIYGCAMSVKGLSASR